MRFDSMKCHEQVSDRCVNYLRILPFPEILVRDEVG
jgi:hypothetical protein